MNANQADVSIERMCRVLRVSPSGFYAWRDRGPSRRAIDDAVMTERIRTIHAQSHTPYGMLRGRAELIDQGTTISRKRVARLMRNARIQGVSRRRAYVVTTRRDRRQRPAPDLVERRFVASQPNELWVADMTYVPTWASFIYLAIVLDVWSRRVVLNMVKEDIIAYQKESKKDFDDLSDLSPEDRQELEELAEEDPDKDTITFEELKKEMNKWVSKL